MSGFAMVSADPRSREPVPAIKMTASVIKLNGYSR